PLASASRMALAAASGVGYTAGGVVACTGPPMISIRQTARTATDDCSKPNVRTLRFDEHCAMAFLSIPIDGAETCRGSAPPLDTGSAHALVTPVRRAAGLPAIADPAECSAAAALAARCGLGATDATRRPGFNVRSAAPLHALPAALALVHRVAASLRRAEAGIPAAPVGAALIADAGLVLSGPGLVLAE